MKRNLPALALAAVITLAAAAISCSKTDSAAGSSDATGTDSISAIEARETAIAQYIRYVDMARLQTEYTLFQEYATADSMAQYRLAVEQNQHAGRIQKRAEEIQNKYQQGLYLTQQSFDSDQAGLQKMQENAAAALEKQQIEFARQLGNMQKQINDSVENVIKFICNRDHYDAILNSAAGLYFNPALDITDEVLKELNKRYTPAAK